MFRKENGVTLVALVITIIVLLILAGVTISMVLGEDGILNRAETATANYNLADIKEKAAIAAATVTTEYLSDKYDGNSTLSKEYEEEDMAGGMAKLFESSVLNEIVATTNKLTVKLQSGDAFTVNLARNGVAWTVQGAVASK